MSLRINAVVPDFEAETSQGPIRFHDWIGDSWAILFSHPRDFTPVCTTEIGRMEQLAGEFEKRGVKVAAVSVDSVESHHAWTKDVLDVHKLSGNKLSFPIFGDENLTISKVSHVRVVYSPISFSLSFSLSFSFILPHSLFLS